jgi:hypothetical protein
MASTMAVIELAQGPHARRDALPQDQRPVCFIDDLPVAFPKPVKLVPGPGKAGPIAPR